MLTSCLRATCGIEPEYRTEALASQILRTNTGDQVVIDLSRSIKVLFFSLVGKVVLSSKLDVQPKVPSIARDPLQPFIYKRNSRLRIYFEVDSHWSARIRGAVRIKKGFFGFCVIPDGSTKRDINELLSSAV